MTFHDLGGVSPNGGGRGNSENRNIPRASLIHNGQVLNIFLLEADLRKLEEKEMDRVSFSFAEDDRTGQLAITIQKPAHGTSGAILRNYEQQAPHVHCPLGKLNFGITCSKMGDQECEVRWNGDKLIYYLPTCFRVKRSRSS